MLTVSRTVNHKQLTTLIFDGLDADTIRCATLHTHGAAGPSGLDSYTRRRLCSSFKSASHSLCAALSSIGRRIATTAVNPEGLSAFIACRLIPLDKSPGVRPIGVGEVPQRNCKGHSANHWWGCGGDSWSTPTVCRSEQWL